MKELVYSENEILNHKNDFSICYCGGGLRACVLTYGSMSELINNMNKIKYISSVSGASWFTVGYTYYNDKIFFDKYIEPENCTLKNLNYLNKDSFGTTLDTVNLAAEMLESFVDLTDRKINRWITTIYESFFENYGDLNKNNLNFQKIPYPIINSTIYYDNIDERVFPIEFTPYYTGIPIFYIKDNIKYGGYNIDNNKCCVNYDLVPYVQSGLSSAFFEAGKEIFTKNKYKGTIYKLFNPNTNKINIANLVDGGVFDNCGINVLLRRKVKNIHVNIYPNIEITNKDFIKNTEYFTSLFKGNPKSEIYGIFKLGLWDDVYNQFLLKFKNGDPLTILITTEIEYNEFFQIESYGQINFLFHISSCPLKWIEKIPNETKKYIYNKIHNFPYLKTTLFKLNSVEINLMYNIIKWDIKNSLEYKEFYSKLQININ
jgi:hypothetical protein